MCRLPLPSSWPRIKLLVSDPLPHIPIPPLCSRNQLQNWRECRRISSTPPYKEGNKPFPLRNCVAGIYRPRIGRGNSYFVSVSLRNRCLIAAPYSSLLPLIRRGGKEMAQKGGGGAKQATLGKFFGANAGSASLPKKQATLAFSTGSGSREKRQNGSATQANEDEALVNGDKDVDMNNDATKKEPKIDSRRSETPAVESRESDSDSAAEKSLSHSDSDFPDSKKLKREKSPMEDSDESNVQPVTKRRKRAPSNRKTAGKKPSASPNQNKRTRSPKKAREKPVAEDKESSSAEQEDNISENDDDLAEEKPKIAQKKRETVQQALKGSRKDPYPDWKAGEPVPYAALCTTFSLIEMTTRRLIILSHCSLFLRQVLRLTPKDLLPTVQLMLNKLAADYAGIELGIGESFIMKAIGESTGRSLAVIKADQHEIGDLGLVAAKSRSNQPTMFKPKPLTVRSVHEGLLAIAKTQGHGSQEKKISAIKKLLSSADATLAGKGSKGIDITQNKGGPSEAKFIIRFLEGKLRLGLAEKTVLVALAHAMVAHEVELQGKKAPSTEELGKGEAILKSVYSELPSYEVIIPAMLEHGIFNLKEKCKLQPGVPLKPMLAKPTKSITEVLDRFEGKNFTCEYKYDGERAQIHYVAREEMHKYPSTASTLQKDGEGICAIFSRNSEDLSKKYPDILGKLENWVKQGTTSFVLDCETVAWDTVNKKVLPFQQLMTRKRKDVKAEDVKVKVCVFAFDLLFLNGEPTVKMTLRERRARLHDAFTPIEGEFVFAQHGDTNDLDEIQTLLDESVKASCEGLMVKMLDTEESGYEPSKRSRNWLKVKKDYLAGIGDSLDLVVLGAYYGRGKRTSVYGAFLLAAYNTSTQTFQTVCNIGTGFSEALLEELHKSLSPLVIDRPKPFYDHSSVPKDQPDVWFEPKYVWEVKAADLTLSPRYKAAADEFMGTSNGAGKGISLRFPRYIKSRDDKKPEEATATRQVAEMYRRQESVSKDTTGKGGVDDDFEY
ncbi:DNA ligase [Histoplasma capsulatum var. duboisii H88]|uniref:DNA ligase n=1 Tax=Ajellomyces capsulatus (strain H88) TaxID=544711 RepID=A0A8A1LGT2_AJEC8|nr:DNA ligase [Histoplasma capsulatum var. duboisii H88]